MLRTFFWAAWFLLYLVSRVPLAIRARNLEKRGRREEMLALVRREVSKWSRALLRHVGCTVEVRGEENLPARGHTVVFASNHQSYMDIPVLLACLDMPHPLLAKKELGKVPMFSGWMKRLGCVFIDREDMRASMEALRQCEEVVQGGESLIIFPEGTRSISSQLGEFKAGAVRVALKTGADIIPVALDGSYRILEGNRYRLQKARVVLSILPPVATKDLDRQAQKALPALLEEQIREELE